MAVTVARRPTYAGNLSSRPCGARRKQVYPIPPPVSSGKCGFWKFAGVLIPRKLRKQVRPVFALLSTADGIVRGVVQAVFAVMRRQDGGSPCGGRGVSALPSDAASCDPPAGRDKRGRSSCGSHDMMLFHAG